MKLVGILHCQEVNTAEKLTSYLTTYTLLWDGSLALTNKVTCNFLRLYI